MFCLILCNKYDNSDLDVILNSKKDLDYSLFDKYNTVIVINLVSCNIEYLKITPKFCDIKTLMSNVLIKSSKFNKDIVDIIHSNIYDINFLFY